MSECCVCLSPCSETVKCNVCKIPLHMNCIIELIRTTIQYTKCPQCRSPLPNVFHYYISQRNILEQGNDDGDAEEEELVYIIHEIMEESFIYPEEFYRLQYEHDIDYNNRMNEIDARIHSEARRRLSLADPWYYGPF